MTEYLLPESADEAAEQLAGGAAVMAGGTTVMPAVLAGTFAVDRVVGLARAALAEAVEADDLGALLHQPARGLGLAVGRAHVVLGEAAPRLLGPVGPAQRDVTGADLRRVPLEQVDGDRLVLAEEGEVDHDRRAARALERHVAGGLAVGRAVAPEVDVRPGVQQHVHLTGLPEPGAPVMRRELEPLVHRRRAQRVLADLQRQVDDPRHARSSCCGTASLVTVPDAGGPTTGPPYFKPQVRGTVPLTRRPTKGDCPSYARSPHSGGADHRRPRRSTPTAVPCRATPARRMRVQPGGCSMASPPRADTARPRPGCERCSVRPQGPGHRSQSAPNRSVPERGGRTVGDAC